MSLQGNSAQASAYATYEVLGFGYEAVDTAPQRVRAVTKERIMETARAVFDPAQAVIVKMLPEG